MNKITVKVDGMMCGICESHINAAVRDNFKVKKVKSSHSKGITEILTEEDISDSNLKEVIDATGYTVVDIKREQARKKWF